LGFGNEIQRAETDADLKSAYAKIRLVQKEFQKPSAAEDPEEQARLNLDIGRRDSGDRRGLNTWRRYDVAFF